MEGRFAASPSLFHKFVPYVSSEKSCKQDVKQDGRNQTDTTPLTVRGRSRSPPAIQPSYPLGAERARFHYPSCVRLTVLRQLFVCEIYSPFDFKGKQGGSRRQERDAGKNKRGVCPCAVLDNWSFAGLSKDQRWRIFPRWSLHGFIGLHKDRIPLQKRPGSRMVFTETICGIHKDRHPSSARSRSL